jgi:PleD family two-component response regulator
MSKRIMIIDEDLMELNRLSQILGCQGYDVCPLSRSYKVFTAISKCQPDLILMDTMLSEMDSLVLSRAIKAIDTVKEIPLMLISGKNYNNYTYAFKPQGMLHGSMVKTADISSLLKDIELKLAS